MLLTERETEIRWDAEEKMAKMWTNDPAMIQRMDVLCQHKTGVYQCVDKLGQSAVYKFPAKLITFRFPTTEEILAEQHEKARQKAHSKPKWRK